MKRTISCYIFGREILLAETPDKVRNVTLPEIEQQLEKIGPCKVSLILSRPLVSLRVIKFPFSQPAAINLALRAELEDLLPRLPENYLHQWFYLHRSRSFCEILVLSVERVHFQPWLQLKQRFRLRLSLTVDSLLVHHILRPYLPVPDCWVIMVSKPYLLANLVISGQLSNSFSFQVTEDEERKDFVRTLQNQKQLPVFWVGPGGKDSVFGLGETRLQLPQLQAYLHHDHWIIFAPFFHPSDLPSLELKELAKTQAVPLSSSLAGAAIFLLLLLGMTAPYFKIPQLRKNVEQLNQKMNQIFIAVCPEVKKIVDPVVQMKEKLRQEQQSFSDLPRPVSVLKVMDSFVGAIPDSLVSSLEVTHFILSGGSSLFISGRVENLIQLEKLKGALQRSPDFASVTVGDISFDKDKKVSFNLTIKLS